MITKDKELFKMTSEPFLTTARLLIKPVSTADDNFIFELVNTEGWIRFIGNRNITSREEAAVYIEKILKTTNTSYWVVALKADLQSIGIITYIKRDYLKYQDIGFAFLPGFFKNGFAFEATNAVLNKLTGERHLSHILATTVPENINSIKLLKKIGLVFEEEIEVENKKLHVYGTSTDKLTT